MAGTHAGALKTVATIKKIYGENFYKRIGYRGGTAKTDKPKGFAADPERARKAGAIGGRHSTRKGVKNGEGARFNRDIETLERELDLQYGRD